MLRRSEPDDRRAPGEAAAHGFHQQQLARLDSAIGDALATAVARVANAEPKTRIIVLLTDGDSNTGIIAPEYSGSGAPSATTLA